MQSIIIVVILLNYPAFTCWRMAQPFFYFLKIILCSNPLLCMKITVHSIRLLRHRHTLASSSQHLSWCLGTLLQCCRSAPLWIEQRNNTQNTKSWYQVHALSNLGVNVMITAVFSECLIVPEDGYTDTASISEPVGGTCSCRSTRQLWLLLQCT